MRVRIYVGGRADEVLNLSWRISHEITDRWGDFLDGADQTPAVKELRANPELLARLRAQMWDETTFLARKDGQWGVLFEVEYCSRESEASFPRSQWTENLEVQEEVERELLESLEALVDRFPGAEFCVPDSKVIACGRPAIWAFVRDGAMDATAREALGRELLG